MFDIIFRHIVNTYSEDNRSSQGELTDVIKYAAVPFAELPDLCPPVLRSSHSRVKLAKSKLTRTQVRTLRTWY